MATRAPSLFTDWLRRALRCSSSESRLISTYLDDRRSRVCRPRHALFPSPSALRPPLLSLSPFTHAARPRFPPLFLSLRARLLAEVGSTCAMHAHPPPALSPPRALHARSPFSPHERARATLPYSRPTSLSYQFGARAALDRMRKDFLSFFFPTYPFIALFRATIRRPRPRAPTAARLLAHAALPRAAFFKQPFF